MTCPQAGRWSWSDSWAMGSVEDSGGDRQAQLVSPVLSRGGHAALPGPGEL